MELEDTLNRANQKDDRYRMISNRTREFKILKEGYLPSSSLVLDGGEGREEIEWKN